MEVVSRFEMASKFASQFSTISKTDVSIITYTKRITLFKDSTPWAKKPSQFDVTMGSFDGAEVWELVGLYLLPQLQHLSINAGLYRDDELATTDQSPQSTKRRKKEIYNIFKQNNFDIPIEVYKQNR